MDEPQQPSLHAITREELTLNPESEPASPLSSKQSNHPRMPAVSFYLTDVHTTTNSSNTSIGSDGLFLASSSSNVARSPIRTLVGEKEPFPDFNQEDSNAHAAQERAYQEAFSAFARAHIREKDVEPAIKAPTGKAS
ncbi:unnamed protein product [Penicillium pancosmium]